MATRMTTRKRKGAAHKPTRHQSAAAAKAAARRTSAAAKHPVCPKPAKKGHKPVKRPKGCVPAKKKKRKVRPRPKPVFVPVNTSVSAARPIPPPAPPTPVLTPAPPGPAPVVPPAPVGLPVQAVFGRAQAERLLWRAGFGPGPGDVDRLVSLGLAGAVASLVRPSGPATLVGPEPQDDGSPLAPEDLWGHDHCWWLDRMVRTTQPLVERMTLIWHDWFATSNDKVGQTRLMLDQNALLRRHALGSFADLLTEVTRDPAMLLWLDGIDNTRWDPNENHARELMELFTLGAGRDAYTETDVRELARTMTGWQADWVAGTGWTNFRQSANRHDADPKTVFGQTGPWTYADATRLCLAHPGHAEFFVTKLWGSFVAEPLPAADRVKLEAAYLASGHRVAPVLEAILKHPLLYEGAALAKSPVVFLAGLLRAGGRSITTAAWSWRCYQAGQLLFRPPNVAGWDDSAWLDTSTWRARWYLAVDVIRERGVINPWDRVTPYDKTETPGGAVDAALAFTGNPAMTAEQRAALLTFARDSLPAVMTSYEQSPLRAMRQNALRLLVLTAADYQVD